jgi:hypothetical protein
MDVPEPYLILDDRIKKNFNVITISNYKKNDVIKSLITAFDNIKVEEACVWAVELHSSGQQEILWKNILLYISESINIDSPYLPVWIWRNYMKFQNLELKFDKKYLIEGRNNQELRNILADVISILVLSRKNNVFIKKNLPKITLNDFNIVNLEKKIIAKNSYMIVNIVHKNDPKELQIGLNEFAICLNNKEINYMNTIYWLEWLLMYEKECKTHNIKIECGGSKIRDVKDKFYKDWIWYIWHIILKETEYKSEELLSKQILALYKIYKHQFSLSTRRSKMVHIYHAVRFLKDKVNWNIPLIKDYHIRVQICGNINLLYRSVAVSSDLTVDLSDKNKLMMLEEIKNCCKKKISKHSMKIRDEERNSIIMDQKTKYLKILKIPKTETQNVEKDKKITEYVKNEAKNIIV